MAILIGITAILANFKRLNSTKKSHLGNFSDFFYIFVVLGFKCL